MNLMTQQESSAAKFGSSSVVRGGLVNSPQRMSPANNLSGGPASNSLDLVGPLVRRKYVVVLFALIGAGLGYLAFQRAEPLYQSTARLMIWAQAPPRELGEESFTQKISLSKFENLLSSRVVLSRAIDDANLANTETLAMSGSGGVEKLSRMLQVFSDSKNSDDTLTLSIIGPAESELPRILDSVAGAFVKEIEGNTKEVGDESLALIRKLEQRLLDEKQVKEKRHLELLKKIGVTQRDANGDVVNPQAQRLNLLQEELLAQEAKLQDVVSRLNAFEKALASGDPKSLRVCAYEAKNYLGLESRAGSLVGGYRKTRDEQVNQLIDNQLTSKITLLEKDVSEIEEKIAELSAQATRLSSRFGKNHEEMRNLQSVREQLVNRRNVIKKQITELREQWGATGNVTSQSQVESRIKEWDLLRVTEESEWLELYGRALRGDLERFRQDAVNLEARISVIELDATKLARDVDEINILKSQIEENRSQVRSILESLPRLDVLFGNYNNIRVRVVDPPQVGKQVAPNIIRYLGVGIFLASILGCGLALLIDRADHSFRSPNEIVDIFRAPVIGRIPRIRANGKMDTEMANTLVVAHQPNSSVAEAMRAIRTAIFFNAASQGSKLLLFTSPSPGDGKSTTISNLAISMAQAGKKVCLVDCDFRRPRVHRYFGVKAKPGGKAFINGDLTLEECLQSSGEENLSLLTCGGHPENPGEFILQPQFSDLFEQLKEEFDFVLIDSPPVIPVSDPTVLAAYVDAIYMVLRVRKGVTISAQQTVDTLGQVEAQIQGVIVNGVDQNPYYNEYNYNYGYQMLGGYYYNKYGGGKYYERYKEGYGDDDATKRRIAAEPSLPAKGGSPGRPS